MAVGDVRRASLDAVASEPRSAIGRRYRVLSTLYAQLAQCHHAAAGGRFSGHVKTATTVASFHFLTTPARIFKPFHDVPGARSLAAVAVSCVVANAQPGMC